MIPTTQHPQRFGLLTATGPFFSSRKGRRLPCRCDCGRETAPLLHQLISGHSKSCGCRRSSVSSKLGALRKKHGKFGTKTYRAWSSMIDRCLNPNHHAYANYGGRGITVCDEWMDFQGFYRDMGESPEGMSLDRERVNEGYSKGNCRWATSDTQANNKRTTRFFSHWGERKSLRHWANDSRCRVSYSTLWKRLKRGWGFPRAMATPSETVR